MKKAITILLSLALVLAMVPAGAAFADETQAPTTLISSATESAVPQEIIDFVKSLNGDQIAAIKNASSLMSILSLKSSLTTEQTALLNKITLDATFLDKLQAAVASNSGTEAKTDAALDLSGVAKDFEKVIEIMGGWTPSEDGTIPEELKAVFAEKTQELLGASYEPIKIVETQVVAGTNYKLLCKLTLVTNPPVEKYVYLIINQDLQGNWSILEGGIEDILTVSVDLKTKSVLTKTKKGAKAVKISWTEENDQELGFDKYIVYRATSKNGKYTKIGTTTKTSYTDSKNLKSGKTYYYKIKGFKNIDGEKVYSAFSTKTSKKVK